MTQTSVALFCLTCRTSLEYVFSGEHWCLGCENMFKYFEKCMSDKSPRAPRIFKGRIAVLRLEERLPSGVFKESYTTLALLRDASVVH